MSVGGVALAAAAGAAAVGLYGALEPNNSLFGRVVGRGARDRRVYLTFDDGPNQDATPLVLDILAREAVPATFFLVGGHVRRFPDIARRIAADGHAIGNHTDSHQRLHLAGPRRIAEELGRAHDAIAQATGVEPLLFRAPHGYRNPFVLSEARRRGYRILGWTFGVWDTARPGSQEIRRRIRHGLRPGSILLLHDGDGYDPFGDRLQTAHALPGIIEDVRAPGYSFAPVSQLFAA
ncbi:MAG TPA: polysaccharide deacetylase family protein [Gemmatimonadales bacterium]|nr:polysaccharide deacetylase family protein [Gemmatimonadales bacterium]